MHPFTIVVADEAQHACGSAFDEAARLTERIPLAALHAVYMLRAGTSLAELEEVASSLHKRAGARATSLGMAERLMAVHVRAGSPVDAIASVTRELDADLVVVAEAERRIGGLLRRAIVDELRLELACPLVLAKSLGETPPDIEPACPSCMHAREQSQGRRWWCDTHRRPRVSMHYHRPRMITWPL